MLLTTASDETEPTFGAFTDHPLRQEVNDEVHARPYEVLKAPLRITHLAMLSGRHGAERDHAAVTDLCQRFGVEPPAPGAHHLSADFGKFRLKWERRTEFSTYTFFVEGEFDDPFAAPAIDAVPRNWLDTVPGPRLVGIHLALEPAWYVPRSVGEIVDLFAMNTVLGSHITGGAARIWTDFCIHDDGFSRILVRDVRLRERQAGRAVQRLLEVETYRMMALLAFPVVRRANPRLTEIEEQLAGITEDLTSSAASDERALLDSLSELAAQVERINNRTHYRFNAAMAYHALVRKRIEELREERIQGLQTIDEFMDRRLAPAMRTCRTVMERLEALSRRISRTGNLLRTRVDVALEAQNRDLLEAMNRRARLQFRLQETVEGLSVAAISYYLMGLVGYLLKAGQDVGLPVRVELAQGALVPVVVFTVWLLIRFVRTRIARRHREVA